MKIAKNIINFFGAYFYSYFYFTFCEVRAIRAAEKPLMMN